MHKARKNINLNKLQSVLRRFYHMTPLGLYSYFISNGRMDLLRRSKVLRTSAVAAVFALVLLTSAILVPLYNKLEITEATTGTAKESSLSFNLTNSTASVDLSVNDNNGTFASSSDDNSKVKFNISTTNYTGYTLSIKGSNNNQTLVNGTNSSYTLSSISTATESFNSTDYNNKWGYLPSKLNSSTNTSYLPAPTTSATTLDKTSSANSSGTVNSYTIGIGARASYTTSAGEYTGTYILTAVGNPINYTVTYNKNTTDTVSSLPVNVSSSTSQTYITLSNNTPTRDGYTFLGWCLGTITTTSNVDSCTGTTYQPGNSFYIDQESANLPTLLAMWEKDIQTIASFTYMQDVTTEACNATTVGATATVKDSRDNTSYTIGKLADGNCWLLENLALDLTNPTILAKISSNNTNASSTALSYLKGTAIGTTSDQWATSKVADWGSTLSFSDPLIAKSGTCKDAYCANTNGMWNYTDILPTTVNGTTSRVQGKIGIYYNFCAASAGSHCFGNGTSTGSPYGNAQYDICPKGWRLPTGDISGEYINLYNAYNNIDNDLADALRTPLAGYFGSQGAYYQGRVGLFWSSKKHASFNSIYTAITSSPMNMVAYSGANSGYTIRCILGQPAAISSYMQDVTSNVVSSMPIGKVVTMKDNRDESTYTIGKLADGNLWLLENLHLDLLDDVVLNNLNSRNTNATDEVLDYLKGNKTGTEIDSYATSKITTFDNANLYTNPRMAKTGSCKNAYCVNEDSTWSYTDTLAPTINGATSIVQGKIGIYYNFCAVTAGSYCYGNNYGIGNAQYDICPRGWRLPAGGVAGEYYSLNIAYGNVYNSFIKGLQVPLSGHFSAGGAYAQGDYFYSWSSKRYDTQRMYNLVASRTSVNNMDTSRSDRNYGLSVRCLFAG